MKAIDRFLDSITMYRLVLYYLIGLLGIAAFYGLFGILRFNFISIVLSALFLTAICWITNKVFAYVFEVPANVESVYITALILASIITPVQSTADLPMYFWAGILAIASKYILAIYKKHIFNPAAIAVVITAFGIGSSASWWVGTAAMLPFTLLGIFIVRKIRRTDLVFYFFLATLLTLLFFTILKGSNITTVLKELVLSSPLFYFAFVMLTEPLTTPPTRQLQILYGVLVGILFAPQFHIGSFYASPEEALVIGNIFSFFVSPKYKVISTVREKLQIAPDMYDLIFTKHKKMHYEPGQYMEWTHAHPRTDSRGNRRYFTIASSPTEDHVRVGIKFPSNGSSYKKALQNINDKDQIIGAQLAGDFTLPKDVRQKLVFIAGGIGITPFRSMIKYLIDKNQQRDIVLLYANKTADEIVYKDVFDTAQKNLGIRTIYTLTDSTSVPMNWYGKTGRISEEMIMQEIPDFKERVFYLSGPHVMVTAYKNTLKKIGIPAKQIKIDFFPGFA